MSDDLVQKISPTVHALKFMHNLQTQLIQDNIIPGIFSLELNKEFKIAYVDYDKSCTLKLMYTPEVHSAFANHQRDVVVLTISKSETSPASYYSPQHYLISNKDTQRIKTTAYKNAQEWIPIIPKSEFDLSSEEGEFQYRMIYDDVVLDMLKFVQAVQDEVYVDFCTFLSPVIYKAHEAIVRYENKIRI